MEDKFCVRSSLNCSSHMVYDLLQAMEHRYNLLADVHSKTVAEKERLGKENEVLRQVSLRPVST